MLSPSAGDGEKGRSVRSWLSNSDSLVFMRFQDAPQPVEGVAVAGCDGIDRVAERGGDFGKSEFAPDAQHEHLALRLGQMMQGGDDEFRVLALFDRRVEKRLFGIGRDDLLAAAAAGIRADKIQRASADGRVEQGIMLGLGVGPVTPKFHERDLHDVLGIRDRRDPLPGEKHQLRSELRVAHSPRFIVGWFWQGPIHLLHRKRHWRPILFRRNSAPRGFEKVERLVVAAALEIVRELRLRRGWQPTLKRGDFLGRSAQFFQMKRGIAREKCAVRDDRNPFAQGVGKFIQKSRVGHLAKVLDGWRIVQCHPAHETMNPPKSILVVDDDVDILRLAREALGTIENCTVETTPNAEYAFELVLKKHYDLLIFDMTMPDLSGAVLYSLIRTLFRVALPDDRKLPPLVLMSGASANRRAQELLREPGVRAFIPKPFTLTRFVGTVEEILAA